jgi:uncharacterized membrane protein YebE (DUF533 family)
MIEWNGIPVDDPMGMIMGMISVAVVCLAVAGILILVAKQVTNLITGTIGKLWLPIGLGAVAYIAYMVFFH